MIRSAAVVFVAVSTCACTNHFDEVFAESAIDAADAGDGGVAEAGAPCASRAGQLARLGPSTGAQRHVAPSGSDASPGTSAQPWKTVQKAVDSLAPGDTAFVHAGVYAEPVSWTKSGTADAPITLAGDPSMPAIFTDTFQLRGRFTRITGLVFDGALRTGTMFPLVAVRTSDVEVASNEFRGAKRVGLEGFVEGSVSPDRARIVGNWFHDGAQGLAWHAGTGTLIASNLFHDHTDAGIVLDPTPAQTLVLGNTLARGRTGVVVGASASSTTAGTTIANNLVTSHREQGITSASTGTGNEARRNVFFSNAAPISGNVGDKENLPGTDPQYVGARDFHLRATSPAVGAADLSLTPVIDRDGRCRPIGAPDLGAFEQ